MISLAQFEAVAMWCRRPDTCAQELGLEVFQVLGMARASGKTFPWVSETPSKKTAKILKLVSEEEGVLEEEILSNSRKAFVVEARNRCIEMLWHEGLNQTTIAKQLGGKCPSTISHALRKISQYDTP